MKLTTKRNWRYFWRELFSYMIPMILIVGTVDVFYNFMRCPLHPEWSAPCSINRILAIIYGIFLLIIILFATISNRMLQKTKKQIENDFLETSIQNKKTIEEDDKDKEKEKTEKTFEEIINKTDTKKTIKPKKIIVEGDTTLKNRHKTKKNSKKATSD